MQQTNPSLLFNRTALIRDIGVGQRSDTNKATFIVWTFQAPHPASSEESTLDPSTSVVGTEILKVSKSAENKKSLWAMVATQRYVASVGQKEMHAQSSFPHYLSGLDIIS